MNDAIIEGIVRISNYRTSKKYPLMEDPIKDWMVREVLLAAHDLLELVEKEKP